MLADRIVNRCLFCVFTALGLAYAVYSSLPILDPSSNLFRNDEGLFLNYGKGSNFLIDLRYGLFSFLLQIYFFVIDDSFLAAVFHNSFLLLSSMFFQPMLVSKYGISVFFLSISLHFSR